MGNQTVLMVVSIVIVVIVGTALNITHKILFLTAVLMAIVNEAGIDPIYSESKSRFINRATKAR